MSLTDMFDITTNSGQALVNGLSGWALITATYYLYDTIKNLSESSKDNIKRKKNALRILRATDSEIMEMGCSKNFNPKGYFNRRRIITREEIEHRKQETRYLP
jgi:hypothetical protein